MRRANGSHRLRRATGTCTRSLGRHLHRRLTLGHSWRSSKSTLRPVDISLSEGRRILMAGGVHDLPGGVA